MNILIYEPSYARVRSRLPIDLRPVLLHRDGTMSAEGIVVDSGTSDLNASWLSNDLVQNGPVRDFAVATLKAPRLLWLHSDAAGFEAPLFGKISSKGARITNSSAASISIAEYVMAEVLYHVQRIGERRHAQCHQRWVKLPFREIQGTTWLIIGLGAIGTEVAVRARAFGARIVGVRRSAGQADQADSLISFGDLSEWLPRADVVVLSIPLKAETQELVDDSFLAKMRKDSILVNVGRGGLVDEVALLAALDRGIPSHVILDVFREEPLKGDSPWWTHPRVSLTAHAAGLGSGYEERADELFLENTRRFVADIDLINEVSPAEIHASISLS